MRIPSILIYFIFWFLIHLLKLGKFLLTTHKSTKKLLFRIFRHFSLLIIISIVLFPSSRWSVLIHIYLIRLLIDLILVINVLLLHLVIRMTSIHYIFQVIYSVLYIVFLLILEKLTWKFCMCSLWWSSLMCVCRT